MVGYIAIDTATAGPNTLVAALSNKKIQVIQYTINAVEDNSVTFLSNSTPMTGPMSFSASESIVSVCAPSTYQTMNALFETNSGKALVIDLLNGTQVSGHLTYRIVDDTV